MKENGTNKDSLLSRWKRKKQDAVTNKGIEKAPKNELLPLSYGQQSLWFLQQLYPDNPFYNYSEGYSFVGKLQVDNLVTAIKAVCSAHDVLSSTYHTQDNNTIQKINQVNFDIPLVDLSGFEKGERKKKLDEISLSNASKQFDLSKPPLHSFLVVKLQKEEHLLLVTLNHIITDKWSMDVFRKELALHYNELCSGIPSGFKKSEIQYGDYAYWQKNQELNKSQLEYWKGKLKDAPPILEMPVDKQRPSRPSYKGALHTKVYTGSKSAEILSLAKKLETTPYTLLLSVFYILLFKYSRQSDILVGSPISNRNSKVLENLMGFFNDTVVLRNRILESMKFSEVLEKVKNDVFESFSNRDIPFDFLVKFLKPERIPNTNPFFQVMFLYHAVPETPTFGPDLNLYHAPVEVGVSKFDLTLYISEDKGVISTTFEYATDLYQESTIERYQEFYQRLLSDIITDQKQEISKIGVSNSLVKGYSTSTTVEMHDEVWANAKGIHSVISEMAQKTPDKIAVSFKGEHITYTELNNQAARIAKKILEHTSGRNEIVALCVPRSIEMIVGLLAILKAGCAYLPLDPEYPMERVNFMLKDTSANTVVVNRSISKLFGELSIEKIILDEDRSQNLVADIILPEVQNTDLAYVIYTSGSTGKPKGVPISHENIISSTKGRLNFYDERPSSFLLFSSIAFDSSKAGIYWTLCTGGNLVISEERLEQDMERVGGIITSNNISHTLLLPSLYHVILQHVQTKQLKSLKVVIVAGEACSAPMVKKHFATLNSTKLYNEYGPTEATVWCIAHNIQQADSDGIVPIGKPVADAEIYLFDNQMNPVPNGAVGEIYVGGPGLSGKYLNRPDLTEKMYVQNPIVSSQNILYKTGDLAKFDTSGNLEFLGRADHQIKIRGHRVELDEIKNCVLEESNVVDAEVLVVTINGADQLFLYILGNSDIDTKYLKQNLAQRLPKHMLPSRFFVLEDFPRLPNGKIDRNALDKVKVVQEINDPAKSEGDVVLTTTQQKLVTIWEDVLQTRNIRIHDNFFEIGGDSILSIQIIAKARKTGLEFSPNDLFEYQTIAELETVISNSGVNASKDYETVTGVIPLSPIQHWYFQTHQNAPHYWNQGFSLGGSEDFKVEKVQEAAKFIWEQHDALRSVFKEEKGSWKAEIIAPEESEVFFRFDILEEVNAKSGEVINDKLEDIQTNIDLLEGPLFRCLYFDTGSLRSSKIVLLAHHLVIDMVSWQLILDDFMALLRGSLIEKTKKTTSILTWANHLRQLINSDELLIELDFWKDQAESKKVLPVDFDESLPVLEKNVRIKTYILDIERTEQLNSTANDCYNTKTDELVLTAVGKTLSKWSDTKSISIAIERHGRETIGTEMNLSNTVGWFTSFFPIRFDQSETADYAKDIVAVKERMRNIPNGGIGYGVLRYLTDKLGDIDYPQVVFNFLGNKSEGPFEFLMENVRHPMSERNYLVEINAFLDNGKLTMNWSYSTEHYLEKTIQELLDKFNATLISLIEHCIMTGQGKFTPSDFPELGLDQDGLDGLLDSLDI